MLPTAKFMATPSFPLAVGYRSGPRGPIAFVRFHSRGSRNDQLGRSPATIATAPRQCGIGKSLSAFVFFVAVIVARAVTVIVAGAGAVAGAVAVAGAGAGAVAGLD